MRGKIKIGATASQEHSVGRWPATVDGDPIDPEMLFDMKWRGSYWNCVAVGYGIHKPGQYGNGSIFVHDKDGVIILSENKQSSALERLIYLGERFQGVDLKFRREDRPWNWEAECFSTKHDVARFRCFGATAEAAIDALVNAVKERMGD